MPKLNESFLSAARRTSRWPTWAQGLMVLSDLATMALAALLSYYAVWLGYQIADAPYSGIGKVVSERWFSFSVTALAVAGWFYLRGHHHSRQSIWEEIAAVILSCAFGVLLEGFLLYADKADVSRLSTFATWIAAPALVVSARAFIRSRLRRRGVGVARTLVIGEERRAADAARVLSADPNMGYSICGEMDFADLDKVVERCGELDADAVVVALSGDDRSENELVAALRGRGFEVVLVPPLMGFAAAGVRMQYVIGQDMILIVNKPDVFPRLTRAGKRAFDVAISGLLLAVAAIPMAIVWLAVRADGGPAIFRHERVGRDGRRFMCLKFRTMRTNAGELLEQRLASDSDARAEWELTRKLRNDPRVTRIGGFLRKSALDELPQLINVIRGDMSLVGPRPVTESELEFYGDALPLYFSARPGLTGLWQVSGRSDLSYAERVTLDAWYVRNWSPWHDFAIMLRTVPALLTRRGAY